MDTLIKKSIDRAQLTPAKRALLEMRLKGNAPRVVTQTIEKRPEGCGLPLSFSQQRLWFLHQMAPTSAAYNMPAAFRLQGILNLFALEEAFNAVIQRHEILRTTYDEVAGEPVQRIHPESRERLTLVALQSLNQAEQTMRIKLLVDEEAKRSFNLKTGPLIRIQLLKLTDLEHVLLVTLHHIVCDGWSIGVFVREMAELYDAFLSHRQAVLPQLPIQYADFAYWQRQQFQGKNLEKQLEYWQQKLVNLPTLDLPTDYSRSVTSTYQGAFLQFTLTEELTSRIKVLSSSAGATLFTTLLATFSILLQRYTGQVDIVTGTVIANRNQTEIENLIGFFVNALPLRLDLGGNPTFRALLLRSKQIVQEAYDHQDLPFDKLVQDLKLPRETSRHPVFQVSIDLDNTPQVETTLSDMRISNLETDIDTTKFDLTVHFNEHNGELRGLIAYNITLFSDQRMQALCKHLENLFKAVASNPDKRISEFSLLTASELRQLTADWNETGADFTDHRCIHELFEEQAARNPNAAAVIFGNEQLTYAQLNAKANQLARYLREMGVKPEVVVGVCIERSLEMLIGILGILKAGGVYLPIDPSYPKERKAFMLVDGAPLVLLTQTVFLNAMPANDIQRVCLDRDWALINMQARENLPSVNTPSHLAYVIYTSGSTGKPKGVAISHRNVVHSTLARLAYYKTPIECFLLLPSFAFDSSVAGIFWTLSQGGCLCLPHQNTLLEPAELVRLIAEKRMTHLLCLPSFYQLLLEQGKQHQLDSLHTVIVAGEVCAARLISDHYAMLPGVALFNEYGPTEGTVWASVQHLRPEDGQGIVSIGCPIDNVEIYLMDAALNLVAPGIKGELYIGGVGLARGYLNRPDQTADRFIPHPFKHDGNRLYKTGDLARFQADGNLEFLGRVDSQVKIRGFRIELGEIETWLMQLPDIKEAAVVVREYAPGDHRLIAFCVSASINHRANGNDHQIPPDIESLKNQLQAFLPEYMVPAAFVFLDQLPLTPNGKVDRNTLLLQDIDASNHCQYEAPRNATEKMLVEIWSEILGIAQVGIHNNFFELGGHSLLTIQVISEINDQFQLDLDVAQMFERPTIAQLATLVENSDASGLQENSRRTDLMAEAELDPSIQPIDHWGYAYQLKPETIFLTGATGFLGVFLLHELLQQTSATVRCLVRAESEQSAYDKLRSGLEQYEIFDAQLMHRVQPVCGDLSEAQFGLSTAQFNQLATETDVIYHNGALVNFIQPYAALKAANVLGTQEVLRLACTHKIKPVHYVSTLSVFGAGTTTVSESFSEEDFPDPDFDEEDGYGQSKWVAEQLIRVAASRGLPVTIHRPATVTGHSATGAWNADNFLCRLIRGCIDIGKAPAEQMNFDIVPVDYVSKAIVYLSQQQQAVGKTFHFNNKWSVNSKDIIAWINAFGCPVQQVSYAQWRENVSTVSRQCPSHPLYPLLSMFQEEAADEVEPVATRKKYSTVKTEEALLRSGIQCPVADRALFDAYLSYLQRNRMLASI